MNVSNINVLYDDGRMKENVAVYILDAKEALVCYIKQFIENDFNTWQYPEMIEGMHKSNKRKNTWYYDHEDMHIQSYQKKEKGEQSCQFIK